MTFMAQFKYVQNTCIVGKCYRNVVLVVGSVF